MRRRQAVRMIYHFGGKAKSPVAQSGLFIDRLFGLYYLQCGTNYDQKDLTMLVSLSELKTNPGKYVAMADQQDIFITKNGKRVARLTNARQDKMASAKALFGILPGEVDLVGAREERLK
jgi:prevent-host-death family protein